MLIEHQLGSVHSDLRDSENAIVYYQLYLNTAKEVTGKSLIVSANRNLGNAYHEVGDFKRAVAYWQLYLYELHLMVAKEAGFMANAAG